MDNPEMTAEEQRVAPIPGQQLEAFREVVSENLAASLARSEGFERRASTLLTVITAALTVLVAVAGLGAASGKAHWWVAAPAVAGVLGLVGSAVFCVRTLSPRDVRTVAVTSIENLWREQMSRPGSNGVQVWAKVLRDTIEPAAHKQVEQDAETATGSGADGFGKG